MQPENSNKNVFCRLCFNLINYTNSEIIDDATREYLKIVLPNLNLEEGCEHLMCKACCSKLFASCNFKSTCMSTEHIITSYLNSSNMLLVDLKEVYLNVNQNIQLTDIWENQRICRLCLQLVTYGFVPLNEVDNDVIDTYIPLVNIIATKDPVICKPCCDSLHAHGGFVKNCIEAQEKYECANKQPYIKSEEIEFKVEDCCDVQPKDENIDDLSYIISGGMDCEMKIDQDKDFPLYNLVEETIENMKQINQDAGEKKCEYIVKYETDVQINKCRTLLDKSSYKNRSKRRTKKNNLKMCQIQKKFSEMHCCNEREYETKHKNDFKEQVTHKDPLEIQMYRCDKCEYEGKHKYCLKRHQVRHKNPSEIQMYKCDTCSYEAKCKSDVRNHQLTHKDPSEVRMYKCASCSYETKYKTSLIGHQLVHKDPSETTMYKCGTCSFETKFKYGLMKHQIIHKDSSEIQMYKCDECEYETRYKSSLKKHEVMHKDAFELQMYKCYTCSFETKFKNSLRKHQVIHKDSSEIHMYICDKCGYGTKRNTDLKKHQLTHKDSSETQMYKCDICSYETKFKSNVLKHKIIHNDCSKIKMYRCDQCEYETKRKSNLIKHKVIHKDPSEVQMYKCDICSYKTKFKYSLPRHELIHKDFSEIEMYRCDECEYETKRKSCLKRHQLTHKDL